MLSLCFEVRAPSQSLHQPIPEVSFRGSAVGICKVLSGNRQFCLNAYSNRFLVESPANTIVQQARATLRTAIIWAVVSLLFAVYAGVMTQPPVTYTFGAVFVGVAWAFFLIIHRIAAIKLAAALAGIGKEAQSTYSLQDASGQMLRRVMLN